MTLRTKGLSRAYGGVVAVNAVTLEIGAGRLTAVIGPNGAGKSTLFNLLAGGDRPDEGVVLLDDRQITGLPVHRLAGLGLARTFQLTRVWPELSVLDNVLVASPSNPRQRLTRALFSRAANEGRERADALAVLEQVGLSEKAATPAGRLSGGQRKLLELARALRLHPRYLLLDEPLAGVAPALGHELLQLVRGLVDDTGLTAVFIEHDLESVFRFSDDVVVMARGSVIAHGPPREVAQDKAVAGAYLGIAEESR